MNEDEPPTSRRGATDRRRHIRLTTDFFLDPGKLAHIEDPIEQILARWLHATSIALSAVQGGDGHVDPAEVIAHAGLPEEYAKLLILDGCWHQDGHDCPRCPQPRSGGVYAHDYLEHNPSAAWQARIVEVRRAAGEAGREKRWQGHAPPATVKRPVGRPRKAQPALDLFVPTVVTEPTEPTEPIEVLVHPAEARAAEKRRPGRPRAEPKVYEPIVHELCSELAAMVEGNGFSVGTIGPAWWGPCEQLLRIGPPNAKEGVTAEQIRLAIRWANNDAFWWENIRSMKNLREKYEQLRAGAKNPNRPKRGALAVTPRGGSGAPPAAVRVSGMAAILAKQRGAAPGGMIKGA